MAGTKEDWNKILPLINAFIEGQRIQKLGYDQRWHDVQELHSLIVDFKSYRIAPEDSRLGTWSIEFEQRYPGSVDGPVSRCVTVIVSNRYSHVITTVR